MNSKLDWCRVAATVASAVLALAPDFARAQIDLSVAPAPRDAIVTPLREQTIRLIASNAGPGTATDVVVQTLVPVSGANLVVAVAAVPACNANLTPATGGTSVSWSIPSLGAGTSFVCDFSFRATPAAAYGRSPFTLGINAAGNSDPDATNNFARAELFHSAVDRPVDVSLTAERIPGGILAPGSSQSVVLTFRNNGPNTPADVYALSSGYDLAPGPGRFYPGYDLARSAETPPCGFFRESEGAAVFLVEVAPVGPLTPGSTRTCRFTISAFSDARGDASLIWRAFVQGEGVYDPVAANSEVAMSIAFGQSSIPVPVARWLASVLAIVLGFVAIIRLRTM